MPVSDRRRVITASHDEVDQVCDDKKFVERARGVGFMPQVAGKNRPASRSA